eukprot:1617975-Prymnesium_polylepis.1
MGWLSATLHLASYAKESDAHDGWRRARSHERPRRAEARVGLWQHGRQHGCGGERDGRVREHHD